MGAAASERTAPALDCNFQRAFNIAEPLRLAHPNARTAPEKEGGKAGASRVAGRAAQDDDDPAPGSRSYRRTGAGCEAGGGARGNDRSVARDEDGSTGPRRNDRA